MDTESREVTPAELWKLLGIESDSGAGLAYEYGYALGQNWINERSGSSNINGDIMRAYHCICTVLPHGCIPFASIEQFAMSVVGMDAAELLDEANYSNLWAYSKHKDSIPVQQKLVDDPHFIDGFCSGIAEAELPV